MKDPIRTILVTALVIAALGAAPAAARGGHHRGHHGGGHHYGYLAAIPLVFLFGWALSESARAERYHRPYRRSYRPAANGCHFVVKDSFDRHGRPVQLGGTKCYDEYGRAYIVPGSPHIVGYY